MPYQVQFENLPIGYATESKRKCDTHAMVCATEFVSSEDGDLLVERLEGFPSELIRKSSCWPSVREGSIEHLLGIIRTDKSATVYVNELSLSALMKVKRPFSKGEAVFSKDIADIEKLRLTFGKDEVVVPPDAGVVFVFSVGWRKGLFYDYTPLIPCRFGGHAREYDLPRLFGQYFAYMMFQELFKITDSDWVALMAQQWFPFIGLNPTTIGSMLSHAREGWQIDELLGDVHRELSERLPLIRQKWECSPCLAPHCGMLTASIDRYLAGDYISAVSILFPRIEGILRSYNADKKEGASNSQSGLAKAVEVLGDAQGRPFSPLLPDKFNRYLREVYFASFDPKSSESTGVVNRNTVSHGVAPAEAFTLKAATIGLLIVDQLSYYPDGKHVAGETPAC